MSAPALPSFLRSAVTCTSIVRSTTRWLKHTVTFEGWLDYIVRKVSRHTGEPIELTDRERRWPWVFLWGRLFAFLRTKNRKGSPR